LGTVGNATARRQQQQQQQQQDIPTPRCGI
jgi:hypothetical protein